MSRLRNLSSGTLTENEGFEKTWFVCTLELLERGERWGNGMVCFSLCEVLSRSLSWWWLCWCFSLVSSRMVNVVLVSLGFDHIIGSGYGTKLFYIASMNWICNFRLLFSFKVRFQSHPVLVYSIYNLQYSVEVGLEVAN